MQTSPPSSNGFPPVPGHLSAGGRERSLSSTGSLVTVHTEGLNCLKTEPYSWTPSPTPSRTPSLTPSRSSSPTPSQSSASAPVRIHHKDSFRVSEDIPGPLLNVCVRLPSSNISLKNLLMARRSIRDKASKLRVSVPNDSKIPRVTENKVFLTPVKLTAISDANNLKIVGLKQLQGHNVVLMVRLQFI